MTTAFNVSEQYTPMDLGQDGDAREMASSPDDRKERKRIQNRVAQRSYRQRMKARVEELQARIKTLESEGELQSPAQQHHMQQTSSTTVRSSPQQQQQHQNMIREHSTNDITAKTRDSPLSRTTPETTSTAFLPASFLDDPPSDLSCLGSGDGDVTMSTVTLPPTPKMEAFPFDIPSPPAASPHPDLDFDLWMGSMSDVNDFLLTDPCSARKNPDQQTSDVDASSSSTGLSLLNRSNNTTASSSPALFSTSSSASSFYPLPAGRAQGGAVRPHHRASMTTTTTNTSLSSNNEPGSELSASTLTNMPTPTNSSSVIERLEQLEQHARRAGFETLEDLVGLYIPSSSSDGEGARRLPRMIQTLRQAVAEWKDWEQRGFALD